jgi:hypothetical protein
MLRANRVVSVVLLCVASVCAAACDDGVRGTFTNFGGVVSPSFARPTIGTLPRSLTPVPVAGFRCPLVQPFGTVFDLVVDGHGSSDLFLDQVAFRFIDGSGVGFSPLPFTAADLRGLFGDTIIIAGTTRPFRFRPQFGCGIGRPHTMTATIGLADRSGTRQEVTLTAPIM